MLTELSFNFGEDLLGAAAAGAISLEMIGTVGVTKRERAKFRRDPPCKCRVENQRACDPNPIGHGGIQI